MTLNLGAHTKVYKTLNKAETLETYLTLFWGAEQGHWANTWWWTREHNTLHHGDAWL